MGRELFLFFFFWRRKEASILIHFFFFGAFTSEEGGENSDVNVLHNFWMFPLIEPNINALIICQDE